MVFTGFEIDMLSLGDADSIVVTAWHGRVPYFILIDGGRAGHAKQIKVLLARAFQ